MANIKRQAFIKEIDELLLRITDLTGQKEPYLSNDAAAYFAELKAGKASTGDMTEAGAKILNWLQKNYKKYNNILTSKIIGEGLFMGSRAVSGSMRKLISDGYVEKVGSNPVTYSLTNDGINYIINIETEN